MTNTMTQYRGRSNLKRQNKDIILICVLNFCIFVNIVLWIVIYIERINGKNENMMISLSHTRVVVKTSGNESVLVVEIDPAYGIWPWYQ